MKNSEINFGKNIDNNIFLFIIYKHFLTIIAEEKLYKIVKTKSRKKELTYDDLLLLTSNAFDVKFADRIHNLKTQWDKNNTGKVIRKIEETIIYILPNAKNINIIAYNMLVNEIKILIKNFDLVQDLSINTKQRINTILDLIK